MTNVTSEVVYSPELFERTRLEILAGLGSIDDAPPRVRRMMEGLQDPTSKDCRETVELYLRVGATAQRVISMNKERAEKRRKTGKELLITLVVIVLVLALILTFKPN